MRKSCLRQQVCFALSLCTKPPDRRPEPASDQRQPSHSAPPKVKRIHVWSDTFRDPCRELVVPVVDASRDRPTYSHRRSLSQEEAPLPPPSYDLYEVRNYCASVTHIAVCEAQRERLRVEREKLKYDSVSARVCATVALPSLVSVTGQIGFQATGFLPPPMREEKRKDPMDVISYPCTWSVWNWWRLARKVLFNRC